MSLVWLRCWNIRARYSVDMEPLGICHAMQEAAGAAVHEQAPGNLDLDYCHIFPGPRRQPQPVQGQVLYGRVDRSRTQFLDEIDYYVEALSGDADHVTRTVFDAEHEYAAATVCECR